ncbi:exosporium glycoprotein BclB-related protein [Lysinibacillus fusiformis]|uniref:exosporium glycoprotein BclB-related protein n=1 Tax=Lysinibacillus fusiformis TaxID=28031 RepID=UPI003BA3D808
MNNNRCNNAFSPFHNCNNLGSLSANDAKCLNTTTPTDNGSIIPFSSGTSLVSLVLNIDLSNDGSLLGFGTTVFPATIGNNTIDLTGRLSEAFTVPRDGSINAISAEFKSTSGIILPGNSATIRAQIFRAPIGSNIFTGTNASIDLAPPITVAIGGISFGTANISPEPVSPGDQLLMVYYISSKTGTAPFATLRGTASAGINIV